jgi:hypothetical protein
MNHDDKDHQFVPTFSREEMREINKAFDDYQYNEGLMSIKVWDEFKLKIAKRLLNKDIYVIGSRLEDGEELWEINQTDKWTDAFVLLDENETVYETFDNIEEVLNFVDSEKIRLISKKLFD